MLTYDDLNRPATATPPSPQHGLTFSYTADQTYHRWITAVTAAGVGSGPYQYLEDSKGRTTEIVNAFGQVFGRQFDLDGKLALSTFPNGVHEERCYTPEDQIASILYRQANGGIYNSFAYYYTDGAGGHDLAGHIRREIDAGGTTHAFLYNNLYELVQESDPSYLGTVAYGYDANGNRTSRQDGNGTAYYGVDANNKLQWVNLGANTAPTSGQANPYTLFHYDAAGRTSYRERKDNSGLLRSYTFSWDGDDRLRAVTGGSTTYLTATYNGDGLRISKSDLWTGAHNYSWGPGGVLTDDNGTGNVYTPGLARRQGSTDRFCQTDWLGSTRYLSDSTGNNFPNALQFDAFGNRSATGGTPYDPLDFQFAGGEGYQTEYADATVNEPGVGLQYLQQRYYDPVAGRFISPDPTGFAAGTNLYLYAGDDPVNGVDSSGTGTMLPLPGVNGARYRTDMTEQPTPDMHIRWPDGSETRVDNQGRVVLERHNGQDTVPVPTDKKKREAARGVIDKFRKKLGLPPCTDEDLNGVTIDSFQELLAASIFDQTTILPTSLLPPPGTVSPASSSPGGPWWSVLQPPSLDDLKHAGGWLVLYLVVSEGSRFVFPPRNFVPAW